MLLLQRTVWSALLLLAQLVEEDQLPRGPALFNPSQPLGGKSCRGCKILSGGFISAVKYGCKPCFERAHAYLRACKVNRRSALTLPPQTWRRSSAGRAAAVSLIRSLCSSSSSSFLFLCRLRADSTQGAMWCVSALSSGLSTVGVRRNVGSEHTKWRKWKA